MNTCPTAIKRQCSPSKADFMHFTFITDAKRQADKSPPGTRGADSKKLDSLQGELNHAIEGLDTKIATILNKQEGEYISSFKYFVGKKEEEIKMLNEKLSRDEIEMKLNENKKIRLLEEFSEAKLKENRLLIDMCNEANKEQSKWKSKVMNLSSDCSFLEKKIRSVMKEAKTLHYFLYEIEVYLAEQLGTVGKPQDSFSQSIERLLGGIKRFNKLGSIEDLESGLERLGDMLFQEAVDRLPQTKPGPSLRQRKHNRHSLSITAHEKTPKISEDFVTREMENFIATSEQSYKETIAFLKKANERYQRENKRLKKEIVGEKLRKNDLENIFLNCVQEVRREMYKRKLKAMQDPLAKREKTVSDSEQDLAQIEMISKLAAFKDNKLKFEHFSSADKHCILGLFISQDTVVQKIYEYMFPHRQSDYDKLKEQTQDHTESVNQSLVDISGRDILDSLQNTSNQIDLSFLPKSSQTSEAISPLRSRIHVRAKIPDNSPTLPQVQRASLHDSLRVSRLHRIALKKS